MSCLSPPLCLTPSLCPSSLPPFTLPPSLCTSFSFSHPPSFIQCLPLPSLSLQILSGWETVWCPSSWHQSSHPSCLWHFWPRRTGCEWILYLLMWHARDVLEWDWSVLQLLPTLPSIWQTITVNTTATNDQNVTIFDTFSWVHCVKGFALLCFHTAHLCVYIGWAHWQMEYQAIENVTNYVVTC